ncbi:MAG TPA: S8 family serine peptidase [Steroidobacteraceae bacterium]|nr:S8 family serine peptidase [Steroidobacteraceae bacterium]
MPEMWRVALIDSGLSEGAARFVADSRRFLDTGNDVQEASAEADPIGHGTRVARIIDARSSCEFLVAQVIDASRRTTPAAVAAAIGWAVAARAHLIHLSLGLQEDRPVLADAVAHALTAGSILVASSPARGNRTFPAAYPGVIRATGDARCAVGEISVLQTAQADFGAAPTLPGEAAAGASIGAAHLSAFICQHLGPGLDSQSVRIRLSELARYHGPEHRSTDSVPR